MWEAEVTKNKTSIFMSITWSLIKRVLILKHHQRRWRLFILPITLLPVISEKLFNDFKQKASPSLYVLFMIINVLECFSLSNAMFDRFFFNLYLTKHCEKNISYTWFKLILFQNKRPLWAMYIWNWPSDSGGDF